MKPPKSTELSTHSGKVRFLVKVVANMNDLETRIEQLEKQAKAKATRETRKKNKGDKNNV